MMTYLLLFGAILAEVIGATATRMSDGFTRIAPTAVAVVAVVAAYYLLSLVLARGMGLGVAYGIWAALGVATVAVVGVVAFGDSLSAIQIGGIALVIAGVLSIELGAAQG